MSLFDTLKLLHIVSVCLSGAGFFLRGIWMLTESPLFRHRLTRVLPHMVDTALLASALGMLWIWGVSPLALPWLSAKLVALLAYIGLGMVAFRFATTRAGRALAWVGALLVFAYMVGVALGKSPLWFVG